MPRAANNEDRSRRPVHAIISEAIAENKFSEHLLYAFAITFVSSGVFSLIGGVLNGSTVASISGTVAATLFYPAMKAARTIRAQNMAIKLLEIPLESAASADEAAGLLRQFFASTIPTASDKSANPSFQNIIK